MVDAPARPLVGRPALRAWLSLLLVVAGAGVGVIGALLDPGMCGTASIGYMLAAAAFGWTRLPTAPFAAFVILPVHGVVFASTHALALRSTAGLGVGFGMAASLVLALVALGVRYARDPKVNARAPRDPAEP